MRVLITGAGSSMGFDVAHCLAGHEIVGADADPVGRVFAARVCDEVRRIRRANDEGFVDAFEALIDSVEPEAVFILPEVEIVRLAERRDLLQRAPVPPSEAVAVTRDKFRTFEVCHRAASFPATVRLHADRLPLAPPCWVRAATGAGARAALRADSDAELHAWRTLNPDVTDWIVQDHLPGENLNVTLLYWCGRPVARAIGRRDGYVLAKCAPSGITGDVADMTTVDRPDAEETARDAIAALPGLPHGFYSVDLKADTADRPHVTEINPRLAARPRLYAAAGVNFPALWLDLLAGRNVPSPRCRPGLRLLRKLDMPPLVLEGNGETQHDDTTSTTVGGAMAARGHAPRGQSTEMPAWPQAAMAPSES